MLNKARHLQLTNWTSHDDGEISPVQTKHRQLFKNKHGNLCDAS